MDLLWWRLWWRRRGTETSVTVKEIDRRVLLVHVAVEAGLITCVWSRIGQAARHSTPSQWRHRGLLYFYPKEVEDAKVLTKSRKVR